MANDIEGKINPKWKYWGSLVEDTVLYNRVQKKIVKNKYYVCIHDIPKNSTWSQATFVDGKYVDGDYDPPIPKKLIAHVERHLRLLALK